MRARRPWALAAGVIAGLAGCGDPAARVALVPVGSGECGRPTGANQLRITAFAETGENTRAVGLGEPVDIADFPDTTLQLAVEVVVGGGEVGAVGKTLPLVFDELEDGATIPIVMAPLGGFCPIGALNEARKAPLVARAGDGVLVLGGVGAAGPLSSAELYDPRSGTFEVVEVPEALRDDVNGLAGAVLATLPDGRVAVSGGARGLLAIFDPETRTFGSTFALAPQRAFHGAVASPRGLLVSGGCQGVVGGTCNASSLRSTFEYTLDGEALEMGPTLALDAVAHGAQLFDLGHAYVLAGGFGTPGEAHQFRLGELDATRLAGLAGQPVQLDGGGLLTAFRADAQAGSAVAMVAPSGAVVPADAGPELAGARLVALEDGRVLALGSDAGGAPRAALYDPTTGLWDAGAPAGEGPPMLEAPSAVRLGDGSVLVLGGESAPSAAAWIYRPSLVGPTSGSVTAVPASPTGTGVLTVPDPRTVTRGQPWVLASADDTLAARALLGGPRLRRGSVRVTATITAGGLALIAQQVHAERALVAHLVPGEPARLEQLGTGVVCTGDVVPAAAGPVIAALAVGDTIRVTLGDATVLACSHAATDTGAWGVAASGAGARVEVATVTVAR